MRNLLWLLGIAGIIIIYWMHAKTSSFHYGNTDFFKFYQAVRFYFAGQSLYSSTIMEVTKPSGITWITANGNLNPPFLTLLLLPLYYFNYAQAFMIWTACSMVTLCLGAWLALRPFPQWHKYTLPILAAFGLYMPTAANFMYGQVTHYMLVLLAGAWLAGRQKNDITAGILIGIACAIKIFCGLFLIYFLCIKRFRLLTSALITGAATFALSLSVFGLENYLRYRSVLKKITWYAASWNVSFYGFFTRLFSHAEKNKNLIALPHMAEICTFISSIALLSYLITIWRKLGSVHFDLGFALTVIAMLLLSPLGWVYYFGFLILPYLILISQSSATSYHNIMPPLACAVLFLSTLAGNFLPAGSVTTIEQVLFSGGVGFYALMTFLTLYILLIKEKLQPLTAVMPAALISEKKWFVFYIIAFLPSLISILVMVKNIAFSK